MGHPRPGRRDSDYPLCEGDVISRIGEATLDNEGMVDFEDNLRLPFTALIPRLAKGEIPPVTLVRDGTPLEIGLSLNREDDRLVKPYRGQNPPFFVYGQLVFSPVFEEVVRYYFQGNPRALAGSPLLSRAGDRTAFPGEELVVVTAPLLAHKIAKGYGNPFRQVVSHVDGVRVKNLHHLVEMFQQGQGEFVTIRFFGELTETLGFRRGAIDEATEQVMSENGIPRRGSGDVMAVWTRSCPRRAESLARPDSIRFLTWYGTRRCARSCPYFGRFDAFKQSGSRLRDGRWAARSTACGPELIPENPVTVSAVCFSRW